MTSVVSIRPVVLQQVEAAVRYVRSSALRAGRIFDTPSLKGLTFASDCSQSLTYGFY